MKSRWSEMFLRYIFFYNNSVKIWYADFCKGDSRLKFGRKGWYEEKLYRH